MFTGIIEEIGEIKHLRKVPNGLEIQVNASVIMDDLKVDDSVAINGICQTVTALDSGSFTVSAYAQTLEKTTLRHWHNSQKVNLERALKLSSRLGGHLVQGHVNGVARLTRMQQTGDSWQLELELPSDLTKYCLKEGSVAIDGISLTIAEMVNNKITINLIKHSYENTTFAYRKTGDSVNIEVDVIVKIIENLLPGKSKQTDIQSYLQNLGW
jgi:riboflavin synthase